MSKSTNMSWKWCHDRWASELGLSWTLQDSSWSGTCAGFSLKVWLCLFSTKKVWVYLFPNEKVWICWSGMNELGTQQKIHPGARYLPKRTLISTTSGFLQKHIICLLFWESQNILTSTLFPDRTLFSTIYGVMPTPSQLNKRRYQTQIIGWPDKTYQNPWWQICWWRWILNRRRIIKIKLKFKVEIKNPQS